MRAPFYNEALAEIAQNPHTSKQPTGSHNCPCGKRISAHVALCFACRLTLAGFESVVSRVQAEAIEAV